MGLEMFLSGTGLVVKGVLLLLIMFSVVSWAIIMFKLVQIHKAFKASEDFMEFFWKTKQFDTIAAQCKRFSDAPLVALFKEGYSELRQVMGAEGSKLDNSGVNTDLGGVEKGYRQCIINIYINIGNCAINIEFANSFGVIENNI